MAMTGFLILTLLIVYAETVLGSLTVSPQDTQVLVGQSTKLTCSTNNQPSSAINWKYYPVGLDPSSPSSAPTFVYGFGVINSRFRPRFTVERDASTGATNLLIDHVNATDAGTYLCQEGAGTGETARAQLIVLEPKPICIGNEKPNSETEGCELELHCSVYFSGNSNPSLEWRKLGEQTAISDGTRVNRSSAKSMNLILTLKSLALNANNSSYICLTTNLPASAASSRSSSSSSRAASSTVAQYNCSSDGLQITCRSVIGTDNDVCRSKSSCKQNRNVQTSTNSVGEVPPDPTQFPLIPFLIALLIVVVISAVAAALVLHWQRNKKHMQTVLVRAEQLAFRRPPDRISYRTEPIAIHTIRVVHADERQQRRIRGVATLGPEIFVASSHCPEIIVYDSTDFTERRRFDLPGLVDAWDIVSCPTNNCLYVMDGKEQTTDNKEIIRFEPSGDVKSFWSTKRKAGYLSVSREGNLVLAVYDKNVVVEYSPAGEQIRKIRISSLAGDEIHPHHACKLDTGHFVVIHGIGDSLHRACIVNGDTGSLVKSFGGKKGSGCGQMNLPKYLAVDGAGSVMVLDQNNNRVMLLGFDLQFQQELVSAGGHGLVSPCKIHLNESSGRLFVAQFDSIHIFDVLQRNSVMPIL